MGDSQVKLKCVLSKYGAYTNHLTALSTGSSVKSTDQAKLQGYCRKWVDAKYALGCAFYIDLLSPYAVFSKVFQSDNLDELAAFMSLLKTVKEINKLSSLPLEKWPTYTSTIKKILLENGERVYQCKSLSKYDQAESHFTAQYQTICTSVTDCLRSRLAWSDLQLIRDVIFILGTQGWEKILEDEKDCVNESDPPMEAVVRMGERFKHPLESNGVVVNQLKDEYYDMITYTSQFISLATMDYKSVWWRLYHAPNSSS